MFQAKKSNLVEEGLRDEMHEVSSAELFEHDFLKVENVENEGAGSTAFEIKLVAVQATKEFVQVLSSEDSSFADFIPPIHEITLTCWKFLLLQFFKTRG